jgi:D-galactarolactone cycloisomerase
VLIRSIRVYPLEAKFADLYGGEDKVPAALSSPASHFRRIKRSGQFSTLLEIESADGLSGWGDAFGLPHASVTAAILRNVVVPALTGARFDDPFAATADLRAYFFALGLTRGAAMEALSAVDIALWDLKARTAKVPLARELGATPGPVKAYVGSVPFLETPEASAERAMDFVGDGFEAIKLKVGRGVQTDSAHVAAVREALGPRRQLTLDANCGYDVAGAIALGKALKAYDIGWLEEPVPPDDPRAMAEVRRNVPMPVAAGENEFVPAQFAALAQAGAVDVLQPNITRAGGVSGFLAIDEICRKHKLALAPHGVGTAIGLAAAVHTCRALDSFVVYEANRLLNPLRDDLLTSPVAYANGEFFAGNEPGLGAEPRRDLLERFAMRSHEGFADAAE